MNNNNIIIMTIRTLRVNVYQTVLFKRWEKLRDWWFSNWYNMV